MFIFLLFTILVAIISEKGNQHMVNDNLVAQESDTGNQMSPLVK